jgi:lipopolysaccharide assembly outer membrane protein LptD (OstA)
MNCFNIRELQGILKRKFFVDLIDSHDYKSLLKESMISLRYKLNPNINLDFDTSSFYSFGIHYKNISKPFYFYDLKNNKVTNSYDSAIINFFLFNGLGGYLSNILHSS